MNDIFSLDSLMPTLAPWAITSALLILAVLAIRYLCREKLSARNRYALWVVVLLRLLIPFQIPFLSGIGAADFVPRMPETPVYAFPTGHVETSEDHIQFVWEERGEDPVMSVGVSSRGPFDYYNGGTVLEADGYTDYAFLSTVPRLLSFLWAGGTAVMALVLLAANLRFALKLRRRRRPLSVVGCTRPVYTAEGLPSPCLFGLFRPAIYLTPETAADETALRHVLAHEQTHYAHGDHIWSALRLAALALHWYDPLVWVAAALSRRDGELACDEGAVKRLGEGERIPYGRTLVDMVSRRSLRPADLLSCSTAMTEGKKTIQQRIALLVKKPETKAAAIFGACTALALAAVFVFAGGGTARPEGYQGFRAQVEQAVSVLVTVPARFSARYPTPITAPDLLSLTRSSLLSARLPSSEEAKLSWSPEELQQDSHAISLTFPGGESDTYLLYQPGRAAFSHRSDGGNEVYILSQDLRPVAVIDSTTAMSIVTWAQRQNEWPEYASTPYEVFQSLAASATAVRCVPPPYSSALSPEPITDQELLVTAREVLSSFHAPDEPFMVSPEDYPIRSHTFPLHIEAGNGRGLYQLYENGGTTYLLILAEADTPSYSVIAQTESTSVISTLQELSDQQNT